MKAFCRLTLLAGLFVSVLGLQGGIVQARTPTPTGTPTASPPATPTPLPFAAFYGYAWLDGKISGDPIVAKIGDHTCGTATILRALEVGFSYRIEVASDQTVAGCGRPGATITFFVAGQKAAQTATWQAGEGKVLTLIAGAPFAMFVGNLPTDPHSTLDNLQAFAGTKACRESVWTGQGGFSVSVLSTWDTDCGTEGAPITFKLLDTQANVLAVANETGTWHAWDGVSEGQQLNLTFRPVGGIRVGNVGDGPDSGASPWLRLSVGLALLGLAAGIGAFALLRRLDLR